MNKKIILLSILLTSCVNTEYQLLFDYAKERVVGVDDILIDQSFIDEKKFSFIKVNQGKSKVFIMSLLSINDDEFEWFGMNDLRIKTKYGRVIETYGFDYDSSMLDISMISKYEGIRDTSILIKLDNPEAIHQMSMKYEKNISKISLEKEYIVNELKESFSTSPYRWSGVNLYWFDVQTGLPLKSVHQTHPYMEPLEIEFYYQYN
jgi:hypothetical protein